MLTSKLLILIGLSVALIGYVSREIDEIKNFVYEDAIRDVAAISDDHALRLESCLEGWRYESEARSVLYSKVLENVVSESAALLVEFGGSSHAAYDYIYVSEGVLESSIIGDRKTRVESLDLVDLSDEFLGKLFHEMKSSVDKEVVDGGCFFITVAKEGEMDQVALYGSGSNVGGLEGWLEKIIKELVLLGKQSK